MNSKSVREYHDAHIQEVTMPSLDGSGKEPAYMTVKSAPREIAIRPAMG